MLDYLEDPVVRKDTQIRLNKGEAEHLLRDAMRLGNQGRLLDRSHDSQILRAKAMSFVEATIVTTNTRELDFVVQELAARGQAISEEILHHITPLGWKHINLTGQYFWDKRQSMKNVGANLERPKLLV